MLHEEIQVDVAHTFTLKKYTDAIQIVPTSATATITDNNGTEVQASTAATIDSAGTMSVSFTAANNDDVNINYRILWEYVYSGTTYQEARLFDVVKIPIVNITTDTDLYPYMPDLRRKLKSYQGETTAIGSVSTIVDDKLKSDDRDFTGGKIDLYVSEALVHSANITAYSSSTGTVTFSPSYSSTIESSIKYTIRESYTTAIDNAFYDFVRPSLRDKCGGYLQGYISGYIDSEVVKKLVVFKALEIITFPKIEEEGDKYQTQHDKWVKEYNKALGQFRAPFDYSEDGHVSNSEEASKFSFSSRRVTR